MRGEVSLIQLIGATVRATVIQLKSGKSTICIITLVVFLSASADSLSTEYRPDQAYDRTAVKSRSVIQVRLYVMVVPLPLLLYGCSLAPNNLLLLYCTLPCCANDYISFGEQATRGPLSLVSGALVSCALAYYF